MASSSAVTTSSPSRLTGTSRAPTTSTRRERHSVRRFFTATAELGFRVNQSLYANLFYDVGNVCATARQFDPTRLFRGAGIGSRPLLRSGPRARLWLRLRPPGPSGTSGAEVAVPLPTRSIVLIRSSFMNLTRRATARARHHGGLGGTGVRAGHAEVRLHRLESRVVARARSRRPPKTRSTRRWRRRARRSRRWATRCRR